jgi:hypothetical protein
MYVENFLRKFPLTVKEINHGDAFRPDRKYRVSSYGSDRRGSSPGTGYPIMSILHRRSEWEWLNVMPASCYALTSTRCYKCVHSLTSLHDQQSNVGGGEQEGKGRKWKWQEMMEVYLWQLTDAGKNR